MPPKLHDYAALDWITVPNAAEGKEDLKCVHHVQIPSVVCQCIAHFQSMKYGTYRNLFDIVQRFQSSHLLFACLLYCSVARVYERFGAVVLGSKYPLSSGKTGLRTVKCQHHLQSAGVLQR